MNNEITQTQDSKGEDKLESIIELIKTIQDHWYDEAKKTDTQSNVDIVFKLELLAKAHAAKSILDAIDTIK